MFAVTVAVHRQHDMQFVQQIDSLAALQTCMLGNDSALVFLVEGEGFRATVADRTKVLEILTRYNLSWEGLAEAGRLEPGVRLGEVNDPIAAEDDHRDGYNKQRDQGTI